MFLYTGFCIGPETDMYRIPYNSLDGQDLSEDGMYSVVVLRCSGRATHAIVVTTQVLKQLQQRIETDNKQHAVMQTKLVAALKNEREISASLRRQLAERTDALGKVLKHVDDVSRMELAQRQQRITETETLLATLTEAKEMLEERTKERDEARGKWESERRETLALRAMVDNLQSEVRELKRHRERPSAGPSTGGSNNLGAFPT
jgi:uncharacterized membrane protein YhiD involved in acid resistance